MKRKEGKAMAEDRCIVCGAIIPEGRQVCLMCEVLICESEGRENGRESKEHEEL